MKQRPISLALAFAVLAVAGCRTDAQKEQLHAGEEHANEGDAGVANFDFEALKLADLTVEEIREREMFSDLIVSGEVEPATGGIVTVTTTAPGKLTRIAVTVGSLASAGQVLATVASADLAAAQASFRQADARLKVANESLARQRKLAGLGVFGRPRFEESRTALAQADREAAEARSALAESESKAASAQADVKRATANLDVAESAFRRAERLLKEGLVSREEIERSRAEFLRAEADLEASQRMHDAAQSAVRSAGIALQAAESRAKTAAETLRREEQVLSGGYLTAKEVVEAEALVQSAQLDRSAAADAVRLLGGIPGGASSLAVRSPIEGTVTQVLATLGEVVGTDKPLFTVVNSKSVWIQLAVYQRDLPRVRPGGAVTITADSLPGKTFVATVGYVGQEIDETTRTAKVRCVVANPQGLLRPGSFVTGRIQTDVGARRMAIAVPVEAIQEVEGRQIVFVQGEHEGDFRAVEVETGEGYDGYVEISSGIKAGDRVVTRNSFTVKAQLMKGELGDEH
ncbi:MAG: efflux RND transporter periplasmic adaptor subunit [Armatimonadetes bacterium]|nr:efflux RND transporter periplasmic adaptor subunit [Armatimonadota bacterium]